MFFDYGIGRCDGPVHSLNSCEATCVIYVFMFLTMLFSLFQMFCKDKDHKNWQ